MAGSIKIQHGGTAGTPQAGFSTLWTSSADGQFYYTKPDGTTGSLVGPTGPQGLAGTSGTSGRDGITAGRNYYFNQSQTSDVAGYKVLSDVPTSTTQQTVSTSLTSNQQNVLVQQFITPELGFTVIPAGIQRFSLYYLLGADNHNVDAYVTLELADATGTSYGTVIASGKVDISWNSGLPSETFVDVVFSSTPINSTDRMIVKLYLDNGDNQARTVVFYTENGYYSYVITSVGVVSGATGATGEQGATGPTGATGADTSIVLSSTKTTNYTIAAADVNTMVIGASAAALTFTVPKNFDVPITVGSQILITRGGTGALGITGAGSPVTILSAQGYQNLNYQYSGATLIKQAEDTWYLFGDLKA